MYSPAHRVRYEWSEYLALEESSNTKHEFLEGRIYAMAGGTPEHAALAAAMIGVLFGQLRNGRLRVHDSHLRIRVRETGLATYPDATVVFGPLERDPAHENAVTNPTLVVEVLSRSTEEYDRGDKFEHYKRIPSLRQYVLVSHREREIEVWTQDETGDRNSVTAREGEQVILASIDARIDVRELYKAAAEPTA